MDWMDSGGDGGRLRGRGQRSARLRWVRRTIGGLAGALSGEACCSPPGYVVERLGRPVAAVRINAPAATTPGTAIANITQGSRRFGPRLAFRNAAAAPRCMPRSASEGLYGLSRVRRVRRPRSRRLPRTGHPPRRQLQPTPSLAPVPAPSKRRRNLRCRPTPDSPGCAADASGSRRFLLRQARRRAVAARFRSAQLSRRCPGRGISRSGPVLAAMISADVIPRDGTQDGGYR